MKLEDWHCHSELCHHAVGSIEDYIKKAVDLKLYTIGICDHFPFEFLKNIERIPYEGYAITLGEIENYLSIAELLREKYKDDLNVRIAFEIDFFENQESLLNLHLNKYKNRLDYILGAIHILNFNDGRGAWGFDDSRFRTDFNYYGPDNVYLLYYKTVQKMLNSNEFDFDIMAHFDLPKKFNDIPKNKKIVYNEVMKTLEIIKKRNIIIEINTSGLRKDAKEQYPSIEIIQEMHNLDISIILGSDAHDPNFVAWEFKKVIAMLKEIGYNYLAHFHKRKKSYLQI
ncbi:MAG: histidinol-phosphatase HisJ [Promethearchaeota archaeon]